MIRFSHFLIYNTDKIRYHFLNIYLQCIFINHIVYYVTYIFYLQLKCKQGGPDCNKFFYLHSLPNILVHTTMHAFGDIHPFRAAEATVGHKWWPWQPLVIIGTDRDQILNGSVVSGTNRYQMPPTLFTNERSLNPRHIKTYTKRRQA